MKSSTYYRYKPAQPRPLEGPFFAHNRRTGAYVTDSHGVAVARCKRRTAGLMVELLNQLVEP